ATGGHRRPLGVVAGLVVSFTFVLFALVYVIDALGLPNDLLRNVAIVVLFGFGVILLIPPLAARVEAFGSRFAGRVGVKSDGDGFWGGVGLGFSLGVLYAPCAGPILAAVLTASASQPFNAGRLAVVIAYALGSAIVLYLLMLGGRRLAAPLARRSGTFQMAMGLVMVIVAFAMWQGYDTKFQSNVTADLPSWLTNPAEGIEKSHSAQVALAEIRGGDGHGLGLKAAEAESRREVEKARAERGESPRPGTEGESRLTAKDEETVPLDDIGPAPEFTDTEDWFNTPGDKPLTMKGLRGKVVLIDFWTYSCINCIRTLPYLNAWYRRYAKDGLVIVGVHTPEFPFEREADNVEEAIKTDGIKYPVVQDNEMGTWNAYENLYWPAEYFVDAKGQVRFAHFGEGDYGEKEQVIRELLSEAGHAPGRKRADAHGMAAEPGVTTPESYLGSERAVDFTNGPIKPGRQTFTLQEPGENQLSYGGEWTIGEQPVTAGKGARLDLNFGARRVYLVLGSPGRPRRVKVLLDGRPIAPADDGSDVHNGYVKVTNQRLYNLVELPKVEHHVLELVPEAGVQGYAFTFG
ncbi:MAG TPA: cytochrome c biogenesis protein DipZ, partial [Solirubrobacterales bacterium]|nr:cytochrome c biogenesis protein DipZ [Solirubrobacterales bacterium]